MIRLAFYMSKTFVFTWLTITFGFLALIGLLDSLANGSDILASGGGFQSTFRYIALRAPVIFDRVLLFTIVVAILLTFVKLIRNHELVALLGFGLSVPTQIKALTPAVLGVGLLSVLTINTLMPPAVQALQAWGVGEYKASNISEEKPLWLMSGGQIIRAAGRDDIRTLSKLKFFDRNELGEVTQITWAERAEYSEQNGWVLEGGEVLRVTGPADTSPAMTTWETSQTPASIARLAAEPRDLSFKDLNQFKTKGNSGSQPSFAYGFWFWHRLTRPLAALILLLCAVPIMQKTGRQDTGDKALIIGIVMGFIYLIIDGALSTFATSGGISIASAISMPIVLFALIGIWLCLRTETLS